MSILSRACACQGQRQRRSPQAWQGHTASSVYQCHSSYDGGNALQPTMDASRRLHACCFTLVAGRASGVEHTPRTNLAQVVAVLLLLLRIWRRRRPSRISLVNASAEDPRHLPLPLPLPPGVFDRACEDESVENVTNARLSPLRLQGTKKGQLAVT